METATKHLKKRAKKKQPWMTEETLNKIEERKKTKTQSGIKSGKYKTVAKEVRHLCRQDKKNYLNRKCQKIEEHMKENRSREMYEEINKLTKPFKPRLGTIKDEKGKTDRV